MYCWYSFLTPFCYTLSLKIWNISMFLCTFFPAEKRNGAEMYAITFSTCLTLPLGVKITTVRKLQTTIFCCLDQTRCFPSQFFTPRLALRCSSQIVLSLAVSHPGYMKGKRTQSSPPDSWRARRLPLRWPRRWTTHTSPPRRWYKHTICLSASWWLDELFEDVCVRVSSEVSQMDVSIWQSLTLWLGWDADWFNWTSKLLGFRVCVSDTEATDKYASQCVVCLWDDLMSRVSGLDEISNLRKGDFWWEMQKRHTLWLGVSQMYPWIHPTVIVRFLSISLFLTLYSVPPPSSPRLPHNASKYKMGSLNDRQLSSVC